MYRAPLAISFNEHINLRPSNKDKYKPKTSEIKSNQTNKEKRTSLPLDAATALGFGRNSATPPCCDDADLAIRLTGLLGPSIAPPLFPVNPGWGHMRGGHGGGAPT